MSITHNYTRGWSSNGDNLSKVLAITANAEIALDSTIPINTTDQIIPFTTTTTAIAGLYMLASTALTVRTNTLAGINFFTLAAGIPYLWAQGDPTMRDTAGTIVATAFTSLHIVNTSTADASLLEVRLLQNL